MAIALIMGCDETKKVQGWLCLGGILLGLGSSVSAADGSNFQACIHFFPKNVSPKVSTTWQGPTRALCYDAFAILHSARSKTPVFVAERLNRTQLADAQDEVRTNRFFADARLPLAERAQLEDYHVSGYDRGHMAPAADMPSATAMAQSFSLANIVPQSPRNNQRTWAGIEKATRKYVMRAQGDVFVMTGPVFDHDIRTVGAGKVWIPRYLYKLVYDPSSSRAWAHWLENTDEARAQRPISYRELVHRTGIHFLSPEAERMLSP